MRGAWKIKMIIQSKNYIVEKIAEKKKELFNFISSCKLKVWASSKLKTMLSTPELIDKIVNFCELYSGVIYFPYQELFARRLIRSILNNDGEEITALFARQSGKSETVATTVGGLMILLPRLANMPMFSNDKRLQPFKEGLYVGIFAPSQRQATITYNRMKSRMQSKSAKVILEDPEFRLSFTTSNGQNVALSNGSFASAISASEGSNIEGESFMIIIVEEAQEVSDFKFSKSISPMGAFYNATKIKVGTAFNYAGHFYRSIERNKKDFLEENLKYKNHYEFDDDTVSKYNPKYAKYIVGEKYRLGESSDEYQMSYKLKWILTRGQFVVIDEFEKRNIDVYRDRVFCDLKNPHVVGIDVAGKSDATVITVVEVDWNNPAIVESRVNDEGQEEIYIAYNTWIKDWLEIMGDDYEDQYYEIMSYLQNFKVNKLVIDATKEASLAHRLRANLPYEVEPFIFSSKSKSEMYKNLDSEIKSGRARVPATDTVRDTREYRKFTQQLGELEKDYKGSLLVVAHPKRRDAHDDYPDSWGLALWGAKEEVGVNETETKKTTEVFNKTKNISSFIKNRNGVTARRR